MGYLERDVHTLIFMVSLCRSPVKKKSLIKEERVLTPKQRADIRKRQRADQEAEKIKRAVVQNYNEGRRRFKEHRKRQVSCSPPPPPFNLYKENYSDSP